MVKLTKIKISDINLPDYNPRIAIKKGDSVWKSLYSSVHEFGMVQPPVFNRRTGNVVGGSQRCRVAIDMGVDEIEVVEIDLPLEKEKLLCTALNKISSTWDYTKLVTLLDEFSAIPDFKLEITGFSQADVSTIMDRYAEPKGDGNFDFVKTLDAIQEPVTKKGDLIILGQHRLLCSDSTDLSEVNRLMGGEMAQLVNFDPPFNVGYLGGARPNPKSARPKRSREWDRIYNDNLSREDYEEFLKKIFTNMDKVLVPGSSCYIWNGHYQFAPMHRMLTELDYHIGCVITWAKPNFSISYSDYHQQTEFCLYAWKNGAKHRWFGPVNESSLWDERRDPTSQYSHPTQKPVSLAQRAIKNSSLRGEIVCDFCLGSASTLIGAESLGRRCFGIEIDPKYCDAIVKRFLAYAPDKVSPEIRVKYGEGRAK